MTKNDLIAIAGQRANTDARNIALQPLSEQDAAIRYARAIVGERRMLILTTAFPGGVFVLCTTVFFWLMKSPGEELSGAVAIFFGGVMSFLYCMICAVPCTLAALVVVVAIGYLTDYEKDARWLAPLAGTSFCEKALDDLENGGPEVAAWRDLILKERSQLRMVDYEVMAALRQVRESATKAEHETALRIAAFAALHETPEPQPRQRGLSLVK